MTTAIHFELNGQPAQTSSGGDTPLLYVLRNELGQFGPRFGCGLAQCGACTVHIDGVATRSCVVPASAAQGRSVTTLDGLAAAYRQRNAIADPAVLHPVQQAFIEEQAVQCGYCVNGWIMTAAALLAEKPKAADPELREGLGGLKCRCGTQVSVLRAVKRAAGRLLESRTRA